MAQTIYELPTVHRVSRRENFINKISHVKNTTFVGLEEFVNTGSPIRLSMAVLVIGEAIVACNCSSDIWLDEVSMT